MPNTFRIFVLFAMAGCAATAQQRTTWGDYLGGNDSSHYSALKQVDRGNVSKLEVAWQYATGDDIPYGYNPTVVGNVMYVLAKNNSIVALDATTGKELWVFASNEPFGRHRGINYWESKDHSQRRLLITFNDFLQAIDARTGKLVDSFGEHGKVDLKQGLGRDPRTVQRIQSGTPGRVFENLIILGSATGEGYVSPPGDLRAYDVVTGKNVWSFHTVPHPGEFGYDTWPKDAWKYIGGTNTWGEISVDDKRGIAYFPIGSPTYDFYGADRKGANLFSDCLLALDARTGKYLWHFQMVHHDLWDYDTVAAPQLITVKHEGKNVDAVAQATKQGFLYVFDRVTGKPVWPVEERPVPKTDMPGESAWPTQPFPTVVPPFARQKFTADDVNPFLLTPEERAQWKDRILSARNEGLFTPPGLKEVIQMPGNNGGGNFWGSAADPTNGSVYVVAKNVPSFLKLVDNPASTSGQAATPMSGTPAQQGRIVYEQNCQVCHGMDLKGSGSAPAIIGAIQSRGTDAVKKFIGTGAGEMPGFKIAEAPMTALLNFLSDPAEAPPTPAGRGAGRGAFFRADLAYPAGVDVPITRYYTGYGNEPRIINPPWSTLTAYDLNTGGIKWQVPYGETPEAGPTDTPRGTIFQRSGVAVTAGGLIIFAANEAKLH
ncbi:MAG TPA: PQQ-binding-like beta-propeller repeat protein, partial [Bryobacteraceae bacterium]|nr:PQQ-binding-like beta-propeller repeat protein [Bryobacteraceae bacterium]